MPRRNEPKDVRAPRAPRHPEADLPRASRDRIGDDAVESDRGQDERQRSVPSITPLDDAGTGKVCLRNDALPRMAEPP